MDYSEAFKNAVGVEVVLLIAHCTWLLTGAVCSQGKVELMEM